MGIILQSPEANWPPDTVIRKRCFGEQRALTIRITNKNIFVRSRAIVDYKRLTVTSPLNSAVCVPRGVSADLRKGIVRICPNVVCAN
jgi:hypothetical protein